MSWAQPARRRRMIPNAPPPQRRLRSAARTDKDRPGSARLTCGTDTHPCGAPAQRRELRAESRGGIIQLVVTSNSARLLQRRSIKSLRAHAHPPTSLPSSQKETNWGRDDLVSTTYYENMEAWKEGKIRGGLQGVSCIN
ncbi:hypothetical protein C8F04DRAFT_1189567 [Mycena alexandri]|uniref:Uncharacterized protein n=1 Tax=Mycena alexandri TaxID=1745969 RepID=A0AAD6WXW7_9AGAR|nr:hypothetical protein C8F04DRAFT_1189567 [Mycena alexandri]